MSSIISEHLIDEAYHDDFDIKKLEKLVKECSNVNFIDGHYGESLMESIIFDFSYNRDITHIIELLIEKGADVNYQDWCGDTCLHQAIYTRAYNVIKLLLDHGANPNLISIEESESVLDFALNESFMSDEKEDEKKLDEVIELLVHYNGKPSGLLFSKKVDTYLLINSFRSYPTGLFTLNGNILIEDIPDVSKQKYDEFMYWLVNGRPAESTFEKYPDSPFVLNFYKKEKEFIDYFYNLFKGEIFVGDRSLELSEKIYNHKKLIYKKQKSLS